MAQINIVNGTAVAELTAGTYNGTATSTGYTTTTITDLIISPEQNTVSLTIGATGILTVTVSDSVSGDPISGAKFKRCNADGTITYGDESEASDNNGKVVLSYLPWAATGSPSVYFIQTATDIYHTLPTTPITATLTTENDTTLAATNEHNAQRTVNLSDSNYKGYPIELAQIDITAE